MLLLLLFILLDGRLFHLWVSLVRLCCFRSSVSQECCPLVFLPLLLLLVFLLICGWGLLTRLTRLSLTRLGRLFCLQLFHGLGSHLLC